MNNDIAAGGPNRYVCFKISKVMRKLQRYYEASLASFEITPVQFYVLSALLWNDGIKFKDLAKSVGIEGSTLTGILDRIERRGFVERRNDLEDCRSLLVYVTEKSRKMGREMIKMAEKLDREIKKQFQGAPVCNIYEST